MSKKVALMCGHGKSVDGSWDSGCSYNGFTEANLMLPITKAAVKYLRSYGVKVISDADTNNNKNMIVDVRWANKEKCDAYISIHCDYSKAPSGVMPLFVSSGGKKLATALNNAVKSGMGMKSRGVVKRNDLWELNGTDMVACILETGAIKADLKVLRNKADAYGKCIAKGICAYLGVKVPTTKTTTYKTTVKELYRVRASWTEPSTQKGAFNNIEGAKQCADVNHLNVYASNGKLVYSAKKKVAPKATTTRAQKILAKANEYAWEYGTNPKKYSYSKGAPKSAYKKALKKYMGKKARVSQSDCGYFVSTCVRASGVAKSFNCLKWDKKIPSLLKVVHKGKKIPDGFLKAGDIIRYKKKSGQHTMIYMGNGRIAEGQRSSAKKGKNFPAIKKDTKKYNKSNVKLNTLQVLRAK